MLDNIVCPISNVRIDRNVVRINGLITTALLVAYVITRSQWIIVPIGIDYVFRAMMNGPTSPMMRFARLLAGALGLPFRAMDKASKVFASRIGVSFAMGAAITHFSAPDVARGLAGTLAVFTMLESVFDFCVGCVVYTYVALPLYRARQAVLSIPLFSKLEEPMLIAVAERFQAVDFPEGERVVAEGTPGTEMFVIRSGQAEVYRDEGGSRSAIATYKEREWFGEMALLTGNPRNASVRALTPVSLLRLQKTDLDGVLQKYPGMRAVLERTADERMALEVAAKPV